MVRIAVRTLTLNVYRVNDQSMLQFIRDRTAAPYFSNLVWFIGNHILELDACVRDDIELVSSIIKITIFWILFLVNFTKPFGGTCYHFADILFTIL